MNNQPKTEDRNLTRTYTLAAYDYVRTGKMSSIHMAH